MATLWSNQPWQSLYTVFFLIKSIPYLTVCSICYLLKPLRPVSGWSYKMSFGAKALRVYFEFLTNTRFQRTPQLTPRASGERFVLIEPPVSTAFAGPLLSATVLPAPVGAMWHPNPIHASDPNISSTKVCIHVPGGALVLGFDLEEIGTAVADVLTDCFGATTVLHLSYRLAGPKSPFPAALQDVVSVYQYVLGLGVSPKNITVVGDSAGGNLVLAFLRYVETVKTVIPLPGSVLVFSPWVDVSMEGVEEFIESPASRYDPLPASLLSWGVNAYRPHDIPQNIEPYIAPRHHPFSIRTPLFISAGSKEGFFKSICEFAEGMSKIEGNDIKLHVSDKMPHDFFMLWPVLGTRNEVAVVLQEARTFINRPS
ncbi:alpha/beta hydrolase fold-3 domain-containing protein [Xylariaceae sp. FL1019]|nr:alpha/beta hydrolase fold-3 domain-containing protein [Xylariaceae sp. FL1019]